MDQPSDHLSDDQDNLVQQDWGAEIADIWERYHREIRRWNRQINLVSRFRGEANLAILTRDCWEAAESIPRLLSRFSYPTSPGLVANTPLLVETPDTRSSRFPAVVYIDIGSGAGFPGVVWHIWLQRHLAAQECTSPPSLQTILVEPRQKRAWFLHRVIRLLELEGVVVGEGRWEEHGQEWSSRAFQATRTLWLVSLRALKMSDTTVISGWRKVSGLSRLGSDDRLLICRFRPPGSVPDEDLKKELNLPDKLLTNKTGLPDGGNAWAVAHGGLVTSLLVSYYKQIP